MSTLTFASASARNIAAAIPGSSGTPQTVTFDCDVSGTSPVTIACSIVGSSSTTQVPGSQVKADRTCSGTRNRWATSTERITGFGQPTAVISSISSKLIVDIFLAVETTRGSVVKTPDTSVYNSHESAPSACASATAVVSLPPRPRNVTSFSVETP